MSIGKLLTVLAFASGTVATGVADEAQDGLVAEVHAASMQQRTKVLQTAVAKETLWPAPGAKAWGDVMWALSLLYLNERVDEANDRIQELALTEEPFAYFGTVDYVRILALFNSRSPHYPGRLEPETEAVMKEALWQWAKAFEEYWEPSRQEAPEPEAAVWSVYASENHDLVRKGNNYIIFSLLAEDPDYSTLTCANGRTVAEYHQLYATYFKKWLQERAANGMWMEVGAEYAKYSNSVLFNLYDLSPDPDVRTLAKMVLDLVFIEEAQISFKDGFRGGGKSRYPRTDPDTSRTGMMSHKQLLFGQGGSGSHSRVFETSQYQVPDIAIYLREFGDSEPPFLIRNRVLGQSVKPSQSFNRPGKMFHGNTFYIADDSALINYCWKTPAYMIGGTLQLIDDANDGFGDDSGITCQDRWGGVVFNDAKHSKVLPWGEVIRPSGSRTHNAYWQVQHENLMIAQKTNRSGYMERLMVFFTPTLERIENEGWVFVSTGDAWAAVNAVGGYSWSEASHGKWAETSFLIPTNEYAPIVFFAGSTHDGFESYEAFQNYVLNYIELQEKENELLVSRYGKPNIQFFTDYRQPVINDVDQKNPYHMALKTDYTYDSPYLKTGKNRYEVWARWGDAKRVYDFEAMEIRKINEGAAMSELYYYQQAESDTSQQIECDVVVYGGTPAGVTAAVQAARMGQKTALISFNRHVGGMTSGGLTATDIGEKESIGGLAKEFYTRAGNITDFSPSQAEALFREMLEEAGVSVLYERSLASVEMQDGRLIGATLESGETVQAAMFVDATYEGDLLAAANVSYRVGREPRAAYDESLGGQWQTISWKGYYQFCGLPLSPYVEPGNPASGLLAEIASEPSGQLGEGDYKVQAYNFRMYLSDQAGNIPFPKPSGYDPERYALLARFLNADSSIQWLLNYTGSPMTDGPVQMRNGDSNNAGSFSSDYVGGNYRWPDGTYEAGSFSELPAPRRGLQMPLRELYELRERIFQDHVSYQQGLMYFLANDPSVPAELQQRVVKFGLDPNEFQQSNNWPHQLYIREGRRMVSDYVMSQADCQSKVSVNDSVGLASYHMDSHFCQRVVVEEDGVTTVRNEGGFGKGCPKPYPVAYRSIVPKKEECTNLLVPVCLSASHVAYGSIRMEPVFMILGQSAGTAAALAAEQGKAVQDVPLQQLQARLIKDGQRL